MLTTLRIKNLALVTDLTLELQPGYNVITGETGAGKSMLIGALNLVLGERADRTLVRSGSDGCSVEAVFDVRRLQAPLGSFLEDNGIESCEDHHLVLKRSFSIAGANRQFVNGSPTSLSALAALGQWLVDIHGPHEHQTLIHPARQLALLDAFGDLKRERDSFAEWLGRRAGLEAEKAALVVDEKTYAQQLELLRFQCNEIRAARLGPEAEEQAERDYARASNVARLLQLAQAALDALVENDQSLVTLAGGLGRTLQEIQRTDPSAAPLLSLHETTVSALRELQSELTRYADQLELDPSQLQQLEERVNLVQSLKRKYGATVAEVVAFGEAARRRLDSLEQREVELERINRQLAGLEKELWRAGQVLSARRRAVIPRFSKSVCEQLADLGFRQSRFDVVLATLGRAEAAASPVPQPQPPSTFLMTGLDTIEFLFAPNPGEPARALRAIASSGELARVMLALKTVLAAQDEIPVLVFDEVDANVGGETAHKVGEKMRQIARNRQVLCVTHLPQVAAPASAHYVATKQVRGGRTVSEITLLDSPARVTELARMLGGQTEAARKHAEALMEKEDRGRGS